MIQTFRIQGVLFLLGFLFFNCSSLNTSPQTEVETETETEVTNPFLNATFYVDPDSDAAVQILEWQDSRPDDAATLELIASQPTARWLGDWNDDIFSAADEFASTITEAGNLPVFVAYNIPNRDCGGYSAGGAEDSDAYLDWIENFANGIGERLAIVILEPDAVASISCLSDEDVEIRFSLLSQAVTTFKSHENIFVYIDAGHSNWVDANEMAERLDEAGIEEADGFSLNISNFYTTEENITYGEVVSTLVDDKHFIIDTSRNGLGSNGEWCNPEGRALGQNPTVETGHDLVDALLWIKPPGQSDGECNGGPEAGEWWAEYALGLAEASL
jgi:endoglucanase